MDTKIAKKFEGAILSALKTMDRLGLPLSEKEKSFPYDNN
jgi:hypothetical protein